MEIFSIKFDPIALSKEYEDFILKGKLFSDDKLYAYAGWLYIQGKSPDVINFEHPPLAKYFIGFSEVIFKNPTMLGFIFSLLTLIVLYIVSKKTLKTFPFTILPVLMLSLDKLYIGFSSSSMLDVYLIFFTLLSVLIFMVSLENKKFIPLLYVLIGLAIACKWIAGFLWISLMIYYFLMKKWFELKLLPFGIALTLLTYTLTYIMFFLHGNTLLDFFNLQIRMYNFQHYMRFERGTPPPFWIFLNFLTGVEGPARHQLVEILPGGELKFKEVYYGLSIITAYNPLTWPLSFSASILSCYYAHRNKNYEFLFIPLSFFTLFALTSFGQVFIWYVLPVLPLGFLSLSYFIKSVYIEASKKSLANFILVFYAFMLFIFSFIQIPSFIKL
jgi:dolichyl-phosphate-mannose--protein O-mannosyl transferase